MQNLVPLKKGYDARRNLGGRPRTLSNYADRYLRRKDKQTGRKNAERLIEAAIERAIKKSDILVKEVWDRVEGAIPRQQEAFTAVVVLSSDEMRKAASILDRMRVIDLPVIEAAEDE